MLSPRELINLQVKRTRWRKVNKSTAGCALSKVPTCDEDLWFAAAAAAIADIATAAHHQTSRCRRRELTDDASDGAFDRAVADLLLTSSAVADTGAFTGARAAFTTCMSFCNSAWKPRIASSKCSVCSFCFARRRSSCCIIARPTLSSVSFRKSTPSTSLSSARFASNFVFNVLRRESSAFSRAAASWSSFAFVRGFDVLESLGGLSSSSSYVATVITSLSRGMFGVGRLGYVPFTGS